MDDLYCTCHRLRKAMRRTTRLYDHALASAGLTVTQFSLLAALAKSPDMTRPNLAALMDMDASTLSRALGPLARRGLIVGAQPRPRGRAAASGLRLSARGTRLFNEAVPRWQVAQRAVHVALGGPQTRDLHDLLDTLPADSGDAAEPGGRGSAANKDLTVDTA